MAIEWKIDPAGTELVDELPARREPEVAMLQLEAAKLEALRAIAEQLERLNDAADEAINAKKKNLWI